MSYFPNIYNNFLQQKIAFDTLVLECSPYTVIWFDEEKFTDTKNLAGTVKDVLHDEAKPFGINHIKISDLKLELNVSAKLLHKNYTKGISIETINELIINLNSTGVILIDPQIFLDTAIVKRCDPVTDITIDKLIEKYFKALYLFSLNDKYNITSYGTANNISGVTGVTAIAKARTVKDRMSFYNKVERLKKDPEFDKAFPQFKEYYKDKIRIESNLRGEKNIKESLEITDNYLTSVLSSKVNYNAILYQKLLEPLRSIEQLEPFGFTTITKYLKQLGIEYLVRKYNYNITAIKAALKFLPRHNQMPEIIATAKRLQNQQQPEAKGLLNEIEEQLINAFVLV